MGGRCGCDPEPVLNKMAAKPKERDTWRDRDVGNSTSTTPSVHYRSDVCMWEAVCSCRPSNRASTYSSEN